jgi:hypothetical protein
MSEFADDPQDVAEQFDEDVTGLDDPDDGPDGEDLSELVVEGEGLVSTANDRAPEEAALHVVDDPRD